jgi:trimeric autotransporter adhesin
MKIEKIMMVSTGDVNNVQINSAVAEGTVVDIGDGIIQHGHCWSTSSGVTIDGISVKTQLGSVVEPQSYISNLTNLTAGTTYYIKAYMTGGNKTIYGKEITFRTGELVIPTISTTAISTVTTTSAVTGGNITSDGGSPITARGVCWGALTGPIVDNSKTIDGTGTGNFSSIISGLSPGTVYYVRAYATNNVGTAYGSEQSFTTNTDIPGAATNVIATAGNNQAVITFTAPTSNGGLSITGYSVNSNPGNIEAFGSSSPITVTGLTNGIAYTFIVTASNGNGSGPASSASNSIIPSSTVPGAPIIGTAIAGYGQATLTFTAPVSNGGSAITSYKVTSNPGSITASGSASPITVSGLTNGTSYIFTVAASNVNGTGPASSASNSVTPSSTVPSAPTIGTATTGNAQATVAFTTPVSNGGSAITSYKVTSSPGSITAVGSASPITVTGLTNGTAYTFTVTASNAIGSGPASSASNSVTPSSTVPGAPIIGTATAGNAQAVVTFTAPSNTGGSVITGYAVISNPGAITGTGSASPITVTGLTNGTTYTFTVTATNVNGTSSASSSSNSVTPLTVSGAPTIGIATDGIAQATVTFTAPASDGGSAITVYTVTSSPGGFTATGSVSPITVTGLTNGTSYTFTVTATNAYGTSPASSASNSVIPSSKVPGTPIIGTATKGNAQATVTFTAPTSDGGSVITSYTITSSPDGLTGTGSSSPITVSGLTNGTAYTFTVTATNVNGASSASLASNSVTPSTVPGAPTIGTATAGNAQATVTFTAPVSNGGSIITIYTVTSNPGEITSTGSTSPIIVTGLSNTAYTFTVTATNANGSGPASSASNSVTPSTTPGPPTIGLATKGNGQATVTFTVPVSNGGSTITGYTVTSSPGSITSIGSASPITVNGLTNGTAYTFIVTATNANGTGPASSSSNSVTPSTLPGAPTIVTATAGNAQASVTFTAPVSDGGSTITGYTVTSNPGGITGNGSASPIIVTGLSNTAYTFTVTATNANGTGAASSASNSVTPTTVPGQPTIGTATKGNAQATVTFAAPISDGGSAITSYTVTSSPDGFTGIGSSSPITVTGLANGNVYTFTVTATNVNGTSSASLPSNAVTPSTVPGAPIIGTATAGNFQATVTFAAPVNNGGSAITLYTVTSSPGSYTATGSISPITVTGLSNGTAYTFTVTATNANGSGPASSASNSVTPLPAGNVINPTTGRIWLDKNLGASQVATSSNDAASYGDSYQWGRAADGHQIRTSGTTSTLSSTDLPGNANFILAPTSPNDWRSPQNNNLWQGVSGVNNPCPAGFRIPTDSELDAERASWTSQDAAGAFASPLKLPLAGYRDFTSGSFFNVGTGGRYWSSTVSSTTSRYLTFSSYAMITSSGSRAIGFSVRCIKD